ncbi:hypothetical protein [Acinetobacter tianfuensis]|uniref:Uncharacterized protein n=1 Tax=Acinetobacter tianfuensis TaxID=2419603 RepID=A0A3A8E1Q7_9GAMM|nr:hypothetical protein [Acinetobacter tianfuensis]RKG29112.1 hypothetical protein D7V32_16450 [Acinetobacter tianfuensis]
MTYNNVDVIPTTEVVEKNGKVSLRTRMSNLYLKLGAATAVAVVGSSAQAAEGDLTISFTFIDTIKAALQSAFEGLQSVYGVAILIVLAIVVFGLMKGGTRKVG